MSKGTPKKMVVERVVGLIKGVEDALLPELRVRVENPKGVENEETGGTNLFIKECILANANRIKSSQSL
jgi:hypothetical protein